MKATKAIKTEESTGTARVTPKPKAIKATASTSTAKDTPKPTSIKATAAKATKALKVKGMKAKAMKAKVKKVKGMKAKAIKSKVMKTMRGIESAKVSKHGKESRKDVKVAATDKETAKKPRVAQERCSPIRPCFIYGWVGGWMGGWMSGQSSDGESTIGFCDNSWLSTNAGFGWIAFGNQFKSQELVSFAWEAAA